MKSVLCKGVGVIVTASVVLVGGMGQTKAEVIVSPVSGTTTMGEAFALSHSYDHSGLLSNFTSGVTDFATYIAGNPQHDSEPGNDWVSNTTSGVTVYDLGSLLSVDKVAIWNFGGLGGNTSFATTQVTVEASANPGFTSPTNLGTFNLSVFATTNPAQVFGFPTVAAEFFRFENFQSNGAGALGLGEVAFAATPEPSSVVLFGLGLAGLVGRRRKRSH